MANLEIERKFLVCGDFLNCVSSSSHIMQGYICGTAGRTVRVRIRDDKAYLTIKGPAREGGFARFEWEKEIDVEDARELFSLCGGAFIDKTRCLVPSSDGRHTWEVDVFHGDNEGLVVAEIELSSEDEPFEKPLWAGEEVTGDRRFYNSQLMINPYKNWK